MLLSHIRCTDRISDGGAEAQIVHIYMQAQAHALTSIPVGWRKHCKWANDVNKLTDVGRQKIVKGSIK